MGLNPGACRAVARQECVHDQLDARVLAGEGSRFVVVNSFLKRLGWLIRKHNEHKSVTR
jgi:hypothetical protein